MKMDRDTFLIFLAVAPVLAGLYLYFDWQTSGSLPLGIPAFSIPTIATPSFLPLWHGMPAGVTAVVNRASRNIWVIVIGLVGGTALGIWVIGTAADVVRGTAAAMSQRLPTPNAAIELESENAADASGRSGR